MPCLNEAQSLAHCIANARDALERIKAAYGLSGEIVIADNGSTDGSQALASGLGARVVPVSRKGYGAALIGGFDAAQGHFLVMGDADGSYDFTDAVAMIGKLVEGAELCMGSRFKGGIKPGAMPWKNRYIGNPALTGILNLFFRTGVDDAHCGLRAIRREAYAALALESTGMEFASEMVIKASLKRMRIAEVPATLSPDLRDRAPHLRPWRDGWRHLRYLFMLSPTWAFGVPALAMILLGLAIISLAGAHALGLVSYVPFGETWTVLGGMLVSVGHLGLLMALIAHLEGARSGYRHPASWLFRVRGLLRFEAGLVIAAVLIGASMIGLGALGWYWSANAFRPLASILPVVIAGLIGTIGVQTAFGAVLLAVLADHRADFLVDLAPPPEHPDQPGNAFLAPVPRYTGIALFCMILHNAIMIGLDALGVNYLWCQIASAIVLLPTGYLLLSRQAFRVTRSWQGFVRYSGALITNFPVQFALIWLLRGRMALPMAVAAPVTTALLYLWNYMTSYWALARRTPAHG